MSRAKPTTNAELLRDVLRRLRKVEAPEMVRIGSWTLFEDSSGNLVARSGDRVETVAFRGTGDEGNTA